jgi:arylsulfatase A-like enzyme/Tfp pilus assembly protein PilF
MKFSRLRKLLILLVILVPGLLVFIIYFPQKPVASTPEISNIIIISIDTCRADYLSCYGYPRPTTPNIDQVAREGILFENVISPIPVTLPAHSSMLTGTIPPYHGVHNNIHYKLAESNITLPEILKPHGFNTAAIVSAYVLDSQFGMSQGFDYYHDEFVEIQRNVFGSERQGHETTRFALEWLDQNQEENFFLFLHYYDPHHKYNPPEPFATEYKDNPYAGEIAFVDHCIGQVIEKLKKLNLYDSSLIIVAGDHGEMLGEHGEEEHTYFIYQSAIKVPLIFKLPGQSKTGKVKNLVGLIDVVPTICGLLGIEIPAQVQGEDLSFCMGQKQSPNQERYLYCESLVPTRFKANSLLGVVADGWKFIQTTRPELYDLKMDPAETKNLIDEQPQRARFLQEHLQQMLEQAVRKASPDSRLNLDAQAIKRLQSLGYVAGGIDEDFRFDQSREDPKDLIEYHVSFQKAAELAYEKKHAEARAIFEKLLTERGGYYDIYSQLSHIAKDQKDFPSAIKYLTKAIEINPKNNNDYNNLGLIYAEQEQYDQAVMYLNRALEIDPDETLTHNNLGLILIRQNKYEQAINHFNKTLKSDPKNLTAHNNLVTILIRQGKIEQAINHGQISLQIKPDQLQILNDLAWIKATHAAPAYRDPAEAVRLARRLCELTDFNHPNALDTLATAYAAAGNFAQAIETADKAIKLALSAGNKELAEEIQKRQELYKLNKAYEEPSS